MGDRRTFGHWVRERREELGLLQDDVAEGVGVDRSTLSRWEAGRYWPPLEMVNALALVLRVSPDVLLAHAGVTVMPTRENRLPRDLLADLLALQDDSRAMDVIAAVVRSQRHLHEHPAEPPRR